MSLAIYKETIGSIATFVTILQFLGGIDICRKVISKGNTGDISGFPLVGGAFSTSLWLSYSYLIYDIRMMITNFVGTFLQVIYILIYIRYCLYPSAWQATQRQILYFGSILLVDVYFVCFSGFDKGLIVSYVGYACAISSILFCASPLVSLRHVIRSESTETLPFYLILAMFLTTGLWCLYGIAIGNNFVKYPNLCAFSIAGLQLLLFVIYPSKLKGPSLLEEIA